MIVCPDPDYNIITRKYNKNVVKQNCTHNIAAAVK